MAYYYIRQNYLMSIQTNGKIGFETQFLLSIYTFFIYVSLQAIYYGQKQSIALKKVMTPSETISVCSAGVGLHVTQICLPNTISTFLEPQHTHTHYSALYLCHHADVHIHGVMIIMLCECSDPAYFLPHFPPFLC